MLSKLHKIEIYLLLIVQWFVASWCYLIPNLKHFVSSNVYSEETLTWQAFLNFKNKLLIILRTPDIVSIFTPSSFCQNIHTLQQASSKPSLWRFSIPIPKFSLSFAIKRDRKGDKIHPFRKPDINCENIFSKRYLFFLLSTDCKNFELKWPEKSLYQIV